MPDTSLPQQYDPQTGKQKLERISLDDLDAAVHERLVPNGGLAGQVVTRLAGGGVDWAFAGIPNFSIGNVSTTTDLNAADVDIYGTPPNFLMDFVLPVGVGQTPNIDVWPFINMLAPGTQGTAFFGGTPLNRILYLSLPLASTPSFYVNSVIPGNTTFDADVTLSGGGSNIGFNFRLPRGLQGIPGITPNLSVNPLVSALPVGSQGQATLTGTAENPVLNLSLPLSPVPDFDIGSVSTLAHGFPATASISGSPAFPLLNLGLPQGAPGPTPNFQIGVVNPGINSNDAQASISGTPLNPLLNLVLPRGIPGLTPNLSVNPTVTPLPVGTQGQATLTGTAENPVLNLSLPLSPVPDLDIGTVSAGANFNDAQASISGTPLNPLLNLVLPRGLTGLTPQLGVNPTVTPLPVGTQGQATLTGTAENPVLNLSLPLSPVPNLGIGGVNTLQPGMAATVTIGGTPANPLLYFGVPRGDVGESPEFTIGTVQTLLPNQPATAWLTGTPLDPILNFGIPRGQQGNGGVTINGVLYENIVLDGFGGVDGGILANTTGQPPGSVQLRASHRLLNTMASPQARALVVNPGDAASHIIKQIRGAGSITTTDLGTEIQISTIPGFGLPVDPQPHDTLRYDSILGWQATNLLRVGNGDAAFSSKMDIFPGGITMNNPGIATGMGSDFWMADGFVSLKLRQTIAPFLTRQEIAFMPNFLAINSANALRLNSTTFSAFDVPPVTRQIAPPLANDLASCINAINSVRQSLINYGWLQ